MLAINPTTCSKSILYVEESFNPAINKFIIENYDQMEKYLNDNFSITFLYLPYILKDDGYMEMLQYNHPTFDPSKLDDADIQEIYQDLIDNEGKTGIGCALFSYDDEKSDQTDILYGLNTEKDLMAQFYHFAKASRKLTIEKASGSSAMIQIIVKSDYEVIREELLEIFPEDYQNFLNRIEKGALKNISYVLDKLKNSVLQNSQALSRLQITGKKGNYKVYLTDIITPNGPKEVKLGPLPMTLLVFFLNRPNGMKFTDLQNHINSLNDIYCELSKSMPSKASYISPSIKKLVHSDKNITSLYYNDSILTRIFIEIVSPINAKYYHITGNKGEIRKITLPRNLVDMDKELQGL